MHFKHEVTGVIHLRSCTFYSKTRFFYVRFKEGDAAYEKRKAEHKGLLRKHVIKKVNVFTNPKTQAQIHVSYNDTLNELWLDEELVTHEEALKLAELYLLKQAEWAEALIKRGAC